MLLQYDSQALLRAKYIQTTVGREEEEEEWSPIYQPFSSLTSSCGSLRMNRRKDVREEVLRHNKMCPPNGVLQSEVFLYEKVQTWPPAIKSRDYWLHHMVSLAAGGRSVIRSVQAGVQRFQILEKKKGREFSSFVSNSHIFTSQFFNKTCYTSAEMNVRRRKMFVREHKMVFSCQNFKKTSSRLCRWWNGWGPNGQIKLLSRSNKLVGRLGHLQFDKKPRGKWTH